MRSHVSFQPRTIILGYVQCGGDSSLHIGEISETLCRHPLSLSTIWSHDNGMTWKPDLR
jgi:hypothetical protein